MKRGGRLVGRAMRVLGLVAVIVAVWMGGRWALVAAVGAVAMAFGLTINALLRFWAPQGGAGRPTDFAHVLDLLRRAVGGRAAWATGLADGPVEVPERRDPVVTREAMERGAAFARLAAGDGATHVSGGPGGTFVAVGDGGYGAGVLVPGGEPALVASELRRVVVAMRLAEEEAGGGEGAVVARRLALMAAGAGTMEGVARAGVMYAHELTQHGTAIVLREGEQAPRVVAVAGADRRLEGLVVRDDAPAARAIDGGIPVVAAGGEDVFGAGSPERRRAEREGVVLPLFDGRVAIGALVIVGRRVDAASETLNRLVVELGPRLAAARALQAAEHRATTDVLTGLPNRSMFERRVREVKTNGARDHATMVYVDLDHFKKLNDSHGHAAGDAALRHVAAIFASHIRDRDLVARIGGEEFAVWLPGAPLEEGVAVAERIRRSVESMVWTWAGAVWPLTVSCGVAAIPEHAQDAGNLLLLADQALYRAKAAGRNRVEKAGATR
jgi:diguanylate cyclase (GGDEF)-like protein